MFQDHRNIEHRIWKYIEHKLSFRLKLTTIYFPLDKIPVIIKIPRDEVGLYEYFLGYFDTVWYGFFEITKFQKIYQNTINLGYVDFIVSLWNTHIDKSFKFHTSGYHFLIELSLYWVSLETTMFIFCIFEICVIF